MSDFRIDKITNRDGSAGTQIAGISTFSGTSGMQLPVGSTEYRGGRGRGIIAGGNTPSNTDTMTRIQISTAGNSVDFGNLTTGRRAGPGSTASRIRAICYGAVSYTHLTLPTTPYV